MPRSASPALFPVVERNSHVERRELSLPHDLREEIGAYLGDEVAKVPEARGHRPEGHPGDEQRSHDRQRQERPEQPGGGIPAALITISSLSPFNLLSA